MSSGLFLHILLDCFHFRFLLPSRKRYYIYIISLEGVLANIVMLISSFDVVMGYCYQKTPTTHYTLYIIMIRINTQPLFLKHILRFFAFSMFDKLDVGKERRLSVG